MHRLVSGSRDQSEESNDDDMDEWSCGCAFTEVNKLVEEKGAQEVGKAERGGGASVELSHFYWCVRMLLRMLVALLFFLLIVSGSVELNPGPGLGEYECIVSYCVLYQ